MPTFVYSAINEQGEKVKGHLIANDKKTAIASLKAKQLYPIKISINKTFFGFSNHDWVIEWANDMSFFLGKGLSLVESLLTSKIRLSKNKQRLIDEVIAEINAGNTLSQSLCNHKEFPNLLNSFLGVGEASGEYAQAFFDFATIAKERKEFAKNLWASLQYPLILMFVMLAMLIGFSELLLPSFLEFFHQNDFAIESSTMVFIEFSKFIKIVAEFIFNPAVFISVMGLLALCLCFKPLRILFAQIAISVPLFGSTYLKLLQHLYLKTFSKLLLQGHHLSQALVYSADIIPNAYLKKRVFKISQAIANDGQIAEAIGKYLYLQPAYLRLIKTGEKTASLAAYSEICADTIQKHFQVSLKRILTWTGPILITTMGLVTVFMVISVVLPLYEQVTKIG